MSETPDSITSAQKFAVFIGLTTVLVFAMSYLGPTGMLVSAMFIGFVVGVNNEKKEGVARLFAALTINSVAIYLSRNDPIGWHSPSEGLVITSVSYIIFFFIGKYRATH